MTTTPFLGCKISLISKSEIRYEGILYTIDPKESTIALSKVRSYGTEDRPADRQVPPRDEIFEYIIFRAGDIKDLIVDDPPAAMAPGLADPAIIQAHSTSTSGATFPSTTFPQMSANNTTISANTGHRHTTPAFSSGQNAINSLTMSGAFKTTSNDSRSQNSTPTGAPQRSQSPHVDSSAAQSLASKQTATKEAHKKTLAERVGTGSGVPPQSHQHRRGDDRRGGGGGGGNAGQHQQAFHQNYSYGYNRRGSGQQQQHQNNYRQNQNHSMNQTNNRFGGFNRQFNHYSGGGGGGGQRRGGGMQPRGPSQRGSQNRMPNQNRVPKEPLKFDKDYDFEKGFEEFNEMEKQLTNLKIDGNSSDGQPKDDDKPVEVNDGSTNGDKDGADDHSYDKTKSFFDTISCEAIERERGNVQRIDWKAERKLNSETFGVPLTYRRIGYGRGRGYGYRGYRSGHRGGGGHYNRGGGGGDTRRYNNNKGPQQQQHTQPQPQPQNTRNN